MFVVGLYSKNKDSEFETNSGHLLSLHETTKSAIDRINEIRDDYQKNKPALK